MLREYGSIVSKDFMARKTEVTSRRVAELAGVSQTTVSFVLNTVDSANSSPETWQCVLACSRVRGRSPDVGLVLAQPHKQVFIDEYIPDITGRSQVTRNNSFRMLAGPNELPQSDGYFRALPANEKDI